jgi:hypothetical protein
LTAFVIRFKLKLFTRPRKLWERGKTSVAKRAKQLNGGNAGGFKLNLLLLGLCTHADSLFFESALFGV